jgi:hypothetical protein
VIPLELRELPMEVRPSSRQVRHLRVTACLPERLALDVAFGRLVVPSSGMLVPLS